MPLYQLYYALAHVAMFGTPTQVSVINYGQSSIRSHLDFYASSGVNQHFFLSTFQGLLQRGR